MATILAILIIGMVVGGTSCVSKEGQLPVLEIGNQCVYRLGVEVEDFEYNATIEVTEEDVVDGTDYYVTEWSFEPAIEGVISDWTIKVDKATNFPLRLQIAGTTFGVPFTTMVEFSYNFPSGSWWPLEAGKEIKVRETSFETSRVGGKITEEREEIRTITYEVVGTEKITVTTGTFKCFRIVGYDEVGKKVSTSWYSDTVKNDVKHITHEEDKVMELKSYSL